MKIVKLTAENVKKLKAVEITPAGTVVKITGPNASGKTTVLDAIWWALGGTKAVQAEPIRQGQQRAAITLDLGEYRVTRTFTPGNSYLKVENAEGAQYKSPQALLDKMVGDLAFDPLAFARANARAQTDILLRLTGLAIDRAALNDAAGRSFTDGATPMETINNAYRTVFEARTVCNRQLEQAKAVLAQMPEIERVEPVSITTLLAERDRIEEARVAAGTHNGEGEALKLTRERLVARQTQLEAELAEVRTEIGHTDAALAAFQPLPTPSFDEIDARLAAVDATNRQAQAYRERKAATDHLSALWEEARALTQRLEAIRTYKTDLMATAVFPIDGLSFGEAGVLYHEVPFQQASAAEQLQVSLAVAMALNPTLRVIRIEDGSLLDRQHLALIENMARAHDMQVWIEMVDETGTVGVYIEDGAITAVNGQPMVPSEMPS